MLEKIMAFTLQQKTLVILGVLLIVLFGIYAFTRLPIDAFPDVTNIQVEVVSHADGLSALEIERSVTQPVETALRGLPKIKQLRSVTKFGLSLITVVFDDDVDPYFARQLVFERIAEAKENVPENVEISLGPVATVMGEIYQFTLEGNVPTNEADKIAYFTNLRTVQEWVVNPLLKTVSGVNEINAFGGYFKQYQVIVSPERLAKYDVTVDEVFTAIQENNRNAGGNSLERNSEQYIVRSVGLMQNISDLQNTVLKSYSGTPVLLRDVAEIKEGEAVRQGAAMLNGKEESVGGIVMMLRGENSREVVERVKKKVAEINENGVLPDGIKIVPFYDRATIISESVKTVYMALLEGSILVLVILYLLLKSIRGSLVVLIALPLSLLATFIIMKLSGLSANLMSLGGLAISIGMIIDATIIQVENVQRHISKKHIDRSHVATVLRAVLEVRKPSIFGELIIATTFLPILALEGIEGKMFIPLAQTVAIALLSSLTLSILVIPALCALFLKPEEEKDSKIIALAKAGYATLLQWSLLKKKPLFIGVAAIWLLIMLIIPQRLGTEFIPVMDEGAFDMDVSLLPGVSLEKAVEVNKLVGAKLAKFSELKAVVSRTGQTGIALDTRGADKTGYVGVFRPKDSWKHNKSKAELTEEMRQSIATIPGIAFSFSQPIQCRIDELIAGTKAQLIVKLFGENIDELTKKADEIARVLSAIEGGTDIVAEKVAGQPYVTITILRDQAARFGLTISDIQNTIEIAIGGKAASRMFEENRSFDIVVRMPEENRNSVEAIAGILIPSHEGIKIPLGQVADIQVSEGPAQISREDGLRRIGIELNIQGRDIGGFVAEAKQLIKEKVSLPAGYYVTWGGQFENQERAMAKLMIVLPVAIGIICLLLFFTFRSIKLSLLVILNLPFALAGGVVSLWISGLYLSVPASIGFIVLFGVAVLNGVVLLSHITQLREEEELPLREAVSRGSADRLRPVLMTALIAIFSLVPMLYASGAGSEIQKPLAAVVVGGLVTSTLLTLILLPALYVAIEERKS